MRPDGDSIRRNAVLGHSAQVTERLKAIISGTPMTELMKKALRSLERFATEVLPQLR